MKDEVLTFIGLGVGFAGLAIGLQHRIEAEGYRSAWEGSRNSLEEYHRTKAGRIDSAYVCKIRIGERRSPAFGGRKRK